MNHVLTAALAGWTLISATTAHAQCGQWGAGFAQPTFRDVLCQTVFDDGTGEKLYAGGTFTSIAGQPISYLAVWDGSGWSQVGGGIGGGGVTCLQAWDDGTGPALYVGGYFQSAGGAPAANLARWDGSSWSEVGGGTDAVVTAMTTHDAGAGEQLFISGQFQNVGGTPSVQLAGWDGSAWSTTFSSSFGSSGLDALASYDSGSGAELYIAGSFTQIGGAPFSRIVRWTPAGFQDVGGGMDNFVYDLAVHDDGQGSKLIAGGTFQKAGATFALCIAAWDGVSWTALEIGVRASQGPGNGEVRSLALVDDGAFGAPRLYVAGRFDQAGATWSDNVAIWDGFTWYPTGVLSQALVASRIFDITGYDDGSGTRLFAGGWIQQAGGVAVDGYATWDGATWSSPFPGAALGARADVLEAVEFGGARYLVAGGQFLNSASNPNLVRVGLWDGAAWVSLGAGFESPPSAFATFDDGGGRALYAAGGTAQQSGQTVVGHLARWDGVAWSATGAGLQGSIADLEEFDPDGAGPQPTSLIAVGNFTVTSNPTSPRVAAWDGASWSTFAQGVGQGSIGHIAVYDSGSGPELYIAGTFLAAGAKLANNIARWDGAVWQPVGPGPGGGVDQPIHDMLVWDDGSGPRLVVAGRFMNAGGLPAPHIAIWDGTSWSGLLSQPMDKSPDDLAVFQDGGGGADLLVVSGDFQQVEGATVGHIAAWDGASWSTFGGGLDRDARALAVFDDGASGLPSLYVAGSFGLAGGVESKFIARWEACPAYSYCTAKINSLGCPPTMETAGAPSAASTSGFLVRATQVRNNKAGLLFYGLGGPASVPFQGGTLCVATPVKRTGVVSSGGSPSGHDCSGAFELDMNAFAAGLLGGTPLPELQIPGTRTHCQWWGRDPGFPPPQNTTLSNGLSYVVGP